MLDSYLHSHLISHLIEPAYVWPNDFDQHFCARHSALLNAIRMVMGKPIGADVIEETDDVTAE